LPRVPDRRSLRIGSETTQATSRRFQTSAVARYPLPEFVIVLGPAVIAATAAVCGAWVTARYGRKVRLKIGDMEAEGRTATMLACC
jgi:hypothetical protein